MQPECDESGAGSELPADQPGAHMDAGDNHALVHAITTGSRSTKAPVPRVLQTDVSTAPHPTVVNREPGLPELLGSYDCVICFQTCSREAHDKVLACQNCRAVSRMHVACHARWEATGESGCVQRGGELRQYAPAPRPSGPEMKSARMLPAHTKTRPPKSGPKKMWETIHMMAKTPARIVMRPNRQRNGSGRLETAQAAGER